MSEDNKNITKPASTGNEVVNRIKIGIPALHQRVNQASMSVPDAETMANRLALLLDDSGSMMDPEMGNSKINHLKDAIEHFVQTCDYSNTSVAIEPMNGERCPLQTLVPILLGAVSSLSARNGTPMAATMSRALSFVSMTRAVLVSDGHPDSEESAYEVAQTYKDAEVSIDCVHIGTDHNGEAVLKRIAEITNGLFIKFDNVQNFAKNFKYLTPGFRAMLTSGSSEDAAKLLGAKEVK